MEPEQVSQMDGARHVSTASKPGSMWVATKALPRADECQRHIWALRQRKQQRPQNVLGGDGQWQACRQIHKGLMQGNTQEVLTSEV